jgi:hypothetical protein
VGKLGKAVLAAGDRCVAFTKVRGMVLCVSMDQRSIKTLNPKCRLFLKIDQERYYYLAVGVFLSEAVSPPRFGVVKQFVVSESS